MRYHKQGSSILEQQGEMSPWLGEVQLHREEDEPRDMHAHFVGSPYQYLEVLPEEDEEEGEMFEGEMWDKAVKENVQLSEKLEWNKYIYQISGLLTGRNMAGLPVRVLHAGDPEFAQFLSKWQEKNKKDPLRVTVLGTDGILGLNTWTVMQWYLGLHKLNNKHLNLSAVKKAISHNTKIIKRLSEEKSEGESKLDFVFRYFDYVGISKGGALNPEYFAYAIAEFQNKIKKIEQPNGILSESLWRDMENEIIKLDKGYEVRFKINESKRNPEVYRLAGRFEDALNKLESRMGTMLQSIGEKINIQLEVNGKDKSLCESINFFAAKATIIALSAAVPGGPLITASAALIGFAGEEMVDYGQKKMDDRRSQDARREEMVIRLTLLEFINKIKIQYWNRYTQESIYAVFIDRIEDARESGSNVVGVVESIRAGLIAFEKFVDTPNQIEQTALKEFVKALGVHMSLIVKYDNQKGIEYWSNTDVSNISKTAKLFVLFTGTRYIGLEPTKLNDNVKKIIQSLWKGFDEYHKYLIYNHHNTVPVFFRINPLGVKKTEYGTFIVDNPLNNLPPADCLTHILKTPITEWRRINEIWSPPKPNAFHGKIRFIRGDKTTFDVDKDEANKSGVLYSDIILDIVNSIIIKFDSYQTSLSLIDRELESEEDYNDLESSDVVNMLYEHSELHRATKIKIDSSAFFASDASNSKISKNNSNLSGSGLGYPQFIHKIEDCVDVSYIRQWMEQYNRSHPDRPYTLASPDKPTIDAVFTEAIHQFQRAHYFDPKEQDGILNASTLDTLGFKEHKLRPRLNSTDWHGQNKLDDIKSRVSKSTNGEFTSGNWFRYIVRPAFLGHKIKQGVHLLLWRKLQEAQTWLLAQPQYKGMTPVQLGRTLGLDRPDVEYSGARLSKDNQAMHSFGLAIDIDRQRHSWIGAGWVQYDKEKLKERHRMLETLRKASGERLPGSNIFEYLHSIAQSAGADTRAAYSVLKKRHDEFIAYLQNNPAELRYWKNSATFGSRDPLQGFLSLHPDLVYALREVAGLAWGAIDFGPRACGDIMHFDTRMSGAGQIIAHHIGGFVPSGGHPALSVPSSNEIWYENEFEDADEYQTDHEYHEAIGEAEREDSYSDEAEDDFNQ